MVGFFLFVCVCVYTRMCVLNLLQSTLNNWRGWKDPMLCWVVFPKTVLWVSETAKWYNGRQHVDKGRQLLHLLAR